MRGGIPMALVHCRTGGLHRLIIGLAVTLGVGVAVPLSFSLRGAWLFSLAMDRAEGAMGYGSPFFSPTDLAVEASGFLVVVDTHLVAVLRVDPISGDRTMVSDAGTGSGFGFGGLRCLRPSRSRAPGA